MLLGADGKRVQVTVTAAVQTNEQVFMQSTGAPVRSPTGSVTQETEPCCNS